MTVRERILVHLKSHLEGVDDDVLTASLGLSRRQHANQECRALVTAGLIERRQVNGKIRNFLRDGMLASKTAEPEPGEASSHIKKSQRNPDKPWDWEGNVQSTVVRFLLSKGFRVRRVADTLTREQGKDLVAVGPSGQELWVSVKGRPERTPRTSSYLMARHYFEAAVHDLLRWREEENSVNLALALPNFVTYRNSAEKVAGQMLALRAGIFWIFEDGKVETSPNFL